MEQLNVNPADLLRTAEVYNSLAERVAALPPQASAEAQRVADTHGPMGYPAALGISTGLANAEEPVNAKAADFQRYSQRFIEHAATYTGEDQEAAQRYRGPAETGQQPDGRPHIQAAGYGSGDPPLGPAYDRVGPQLIDPKNPLIGDERFGHWEQYLPPPYTGATPPPPTPGHVDFPPGMPAKTGGPSGFYTPGRTWVTDDQAPFGSYSEQYKFRISGEDLTSYTRTVMVDGQPELQRWVANTYEAQQTTQINIGGPAWASTDPNPLEGTLGGVTTGGLAGITPPPIFHDWKPMTPQQIAVLSNANPTVTYYIPDGCGGQFTFQNGVPIGGMAPPPMIPIMTRPPGS